MTQARDTRRDLERAAREDHRSADEPETGRPDASDLLGQSEFSTTEAGEAVRHPMRPGATSEVPLEWAPAELARRALESATETGNPHDDLDYEADSEESTPDDWQEDEELPA